MTLPSKQTALDSNIDEALLLLIDLGQVPMAWDEESDDFVFYVNDGLACMLLVDIDLCSMTWDEECEDFRFYMTDEQKAKHDSLEDPTDYIRKHGKIKYDPPL